MTDKTLEIDFPIDQISPQGKSWDEDVDRLFSCAEDFLLSVRKINDRFDVILVLIDEPSGTFRLQPIIVNEGINYGMIPSLEIILEGVDAVGYVIIAGVSGTIAVIYSAMESSKRGRAYFGGIAEDLDPEDPIFKPLFNIAGVEQIRASGCELDN